MTTGNDTKDYRVTVSTPTGNVPNIGSYWSRIWNGADDPLTSPGVRNPPGFYAGATVRKYWHRPPKRGRSHGEHAYTCTISSSLNPLGTYVSIGSTITQYTSFEALCGGCKFTTKWTSNEDIALLGKLREKVSGGTFNAAVTMAEANESLQMIFGVAKALDGAYRHAKRGNFAAAQKSLLAYERGSGKGRTLVRTMSSAWLQFQYGVAPLLNDVYEAAQTLAHLTSVPLQQTYTVTKKKHGVVSVQIAPANYKLSTTDGYEAVKIKAIVREVNVVQLLGLTDPLSVAWEKLPYSFVADWFVPVGAFLAARGLAQALTGTFVTTRTVRWSANGAYLVGYKSFSGFDQYRSRSVSVNRSVSTSLFVPRPSIKPLGKMLTWSHTSSAVSLLIQRHGSSSRAQASGE